MEIVNEGRKRESGDSDDSRGGKRQRLPAHPGTSAPIPGAPATPSGLSAIFQIGRQKQLFGMLDIRTAKRLATVSQNWHSEVGRLTKVLELTGRRRIGTQDFWTSDPATEPKRYFKQMDVFGNVQDVPHIAEQVGHPRHVTDVATMSWPAPTSHLPAGNYPTKVQYHQNTLVPSSHESYQLGPSDLPKKPKDGRVLAQAPTAAREAADVFIETKSHNKALTGPLPPSYPRTRLTAEQLTRTLPESQTDFQNQRVRIFERK